MKPLSTHSIRCLGALAALVERGDDGYSRSAVFFSRNDIGRIVWETGGGVQLKTMKVLLAAGLVRSEVEQAVDLVAQRICSCGCDRWTITDRAHNELIRQNVKVPVLPKPKRAKRPQTSGISVTDWEDLTEAADWWKKNADDTEDKPK